MGPLNIRFFFWFSQRSCNYRQQKRRPIFGRSHFETQRPILPPADTACAIVTLVSFSAHSGLFIKKDEHHIVLRQDICAVQTRVLSPRAKMFNTFHTYVSALSLCEDVHTIMCTESEKSEMSFDSNGLSSDQRGVMLRYASSPDVGSGPGQSSACEFAERGRQAERSC